jgi:hypothetical protein
VCAGAGATQGYCRALEVADSVEVETPGSLFNAFLGPVRARIIPGVAVALPKLL